MVLKNDLISFLNINLKIEANGSDGKESACNAGDSVLIPGSRGSHEEGTGYPLNILSWRIPWTKEPVGLSSMG